MCGYSGNSVETGEVESLLNKKFCMNFRIVSDSRLKVSKLDLLGVCQCLFQQHFLACLNFCTDCMDHF